MSSNHAITIDGDTASARAYFFAVHVTSEDQRDHADVGGWYNATFRRVEDEWKYVMLDDVFVWKGGQNALPDETVGAPE